MRGSRRSADASAPGVESFVYMKIMARLMPMSSQPLGYPSPITAGMVSMALPQAIQAPLNAS